MITTKKWQQLRDWMETLEISEEDLVEKFILGSGSGGQKLQKTTSTVSLQHKPSGITIKCQESRLRETNRYYARRRLCEKIEVIKLGEKSKKKQEIEKIRRQKRKRSKRAKEKILEEKRQRSGIKKSREKPDVNGS